MSGKPQRALARRMRAKLTVINGEGGPRVAKLTAKMAATMTPDEALYQPSSPSRSQRCSTCNAFGSAKAGWGKCSKLREPGRRSVLAEVRSGGYCTLWTGEAQVAKSESAAPLIVPLDRLRFRGRTELVRTKVHTFGELKKKLPFSQLPLTAPTHGPAPVWERQPTPDFADIYFQPESDERNKLRREQQHNRKKATAARNAGIYSFHGEVHDGEPELRYDPETTLNVSGTHGQAPGRRQKTALVVPKRMDTVARLAAGTTDQGSAYQDDPDEDEDEKRKRKRRFVLRRTTRRTE